MPKKNEDTVAEVETSENGTPTGILIVKRSSEFETSDEDAKVVVEVTVQWNAGVDLQTSTELFGADNVKERFDRQMNRDIGNKVRQLIRQYGDQEAEKDEPNFDGIEALVQTAFASHDPFAEPVRTGGRKRKTDEELFNEMSPEDQKAKIARLMEIAGLETA